MAAFYGAHHGWGSVEALTELSDQYAEEAYQAAARGLWEANSNQSGSKEQRRAERRRCRDLFNRRFLSIHLSIPEKDSDVTEDFCLTKDAFLRTVRVVLGQDASAEPELWNGALKLQQHLIKKLILSPAWNLVVKELQGNRSDSNNSKILHALQESANQLFQQPAAAFVPLSSTATSSTRSESSEGDLQQESDMFGQDEHEQADDQTGTAEVNVSSDQESEQDQSDNVPETVSALSASVLDDFCPKRLELDPTGSFPVFEVKNTFLQLFEGKYEPSYCPAKSCPDLSYGHTNGKGRSTLAPSVAESNDVANEQQQFKAGFSAQPQDKQNAFCQHQSGETTDDALLQAEALLTSLEIKKDVAQMNKLGKLVSKYLSVIPESGYNDFWNATLARLLNSLRLLRDLSEAKEVLVAAAISASNAGVHFLSTIRNCANTDYKSTSSHDWLSNMEFTQILDAWIYCIGNTSLYEMSAIKLSTLLTTSTSFLDIENANVSKLQKLTETLKRLTSKQREHITASDSKRLQASLERVCTLFSPKDGPEERALINSCLKILKCFQHTKGEILGLDILVDGDVADSAGNPQLLMNKNYVLKLMEMFHSSKQLPEALIPLVVYTNSLRETWSLLCGSTSQNASQEGLNQDSEVKIHMVKTISSELSAALQIFISSNTSDDTDGGYISRELTWARSVLRAVMRQQVDRSLLGSLEWAFHQDAIWQNYENDRDDEHKHFLLLGLLFGPEVVLDHLEQLKPSSSPKGVDAIRALASLLDLQEKPSSILLFRALTILLNLSNSPDWADDKWKCTHSALAGGMGSICSKLAMVTNCDDHSFYLPGIRDAICCIEDRASSKLHDWEDISAFMFESLWALNAIFKAWPEIAVEEHKGSKTLISWVQQKYGQMGQAWTCALKLDSLVSKSRR